MSFSGNTLYKISYVDYFNQSHEILIKENGYAGALTEVEARGNPFSRNHDSASDDVHEPMNGSSATIRLIAETNFQFIDLYTSNNRKYQVIHNIGGTLDWKGFILPDQYQEQYKGPPYVNEFIVADQIGFLRVLAWDRTTVETELVTLHAILKKTDLEMDLWEGINVYEDNHNSGDADSPLDQTYINTEVFAGLTYYDALYQLLFKYGAVIKQDRGEWFISRPDEATGAFRRRNYTYSNGAYTYSSDESYDPVVLTTSAPPDTAVSDLVRIAAGGTLDIDPAWRNYELTQNYGKIESIIKNPFFLNWTGGAPDNWRLEPASGIIQDGDRAKVFAINGLSLAMQQDVSLVASTRYKVRIEWDVFVKVGTSMDASFTILMVGTGSPAVRRFDFDTNQWGSQAGPGFSKTYDNTGGANAITQTENVEVVTDRNTLTGIVLFSVLLNKPTSTDTENFVAFKEVSVQILREISAEETAEFEQELVDPVIIDPANSDNGDDFELIITDLLISGE